MSGNPAPICRSHRHPGCCLGGVLCRRLVAAIPTKPAACCLAQPTRRSSMRCVSARTSRIACTSVIRRPTRTARTAYALGFADLRALDASLSGARPAKIIYHRTSMSAPTSRPKTSAPRRLTAS